MMRALVLFIAPAAALPADARVVARPSTQERTAFRIATEHRVRALHAADAYPTTLEIAADARSESYSDACFAAFAAINQ